MKYHSTVVGALALLLTTATPPLASLRAEPLEAVPEHEILLASLEPFRVEDCQVAYRTNAKRPQPYHGSALAQPALNTAQPTNLVTALPAGIPGLLEGEKADLPRLTIEPPLVEEKLGGFIGIMMPTLDPAHVREVTGFRLWHYEGGTYQSRQFVDLPGPDGITWDSLVYHFRIGERTLIGPAFHFMQPNARGLSLVAGFQLTHTFGPKGR